MKKTVLVAAMLLSGFSAQAQMADTLGALAVQGEISTDGYKAISQGQQALSRMQFQQDLAMLVNDIRINYMGNYSGISKDNVMSQGIRGVDWNVSDDGSMGFVISVNGLDGATCFICTSPNFSAKKVDINGGGSCNAAGNSVKMYFD